MKRRGAKPQGKVKIKWSPSFAYAIGLLVSDGCLSPDSRHISFVSKDKEQLEHFKKALGLTVIISKTRVQFGDIFFYRFLESIGLMQNKSKIIEKITLPKKYFFDFLRGSFDGDGCTYSYWDPRWRSSFMFYTTFVSASEKHILWLQEEIDKRLSICGHITKSKNSSVFQLKYAKADSLKLLRKMYYSKKLPHLTRKRLKIEKMLSIVGEQLYSARVLKLVDIYP